MKQLSGVLRHSLLLRSFLFTAFATAVSSTPVLGALTAFETFPQPIEVKDFNSRINSIYQKFNKMETSCLQSLSSELGRDWERDSQTGQPIGLTITFPYLITSCGGTEQACTGGNADSVYIEYVMERFLSGYAKVETTGCHELVHAYMRHFMSASAYRALPRWAREGSAVYLSRQLNEKLNELILRTEGEYKTAGQYVNGLEGEHGFRDYFEDALAFSFLDSIKSGAVQAVLRSVLEGVPIYAAIERETGLSQEDFLNQAKIFALRALAGYVGAFDPKVWTATDLYLGGSAQWEKSREVLIDFLAHENYTFDVNQNLNFGTKAADPKRFSAPVAYSLKLLAKMDARSLNATQWVRAEHLLNLLLGDLPSDRYGSVSSDLRFLRAKTLRKLGRTADALTEFYQIYGESVESPRLRLAATKWIGQLHFDMGQTQLAYQWWGGSTVSPLNPES
jgi:hypothetical protein